MQGPARERETAREGGRMIRLFSEGDRHIRALNCS
jgi:hypothetical protein